MKAAYIVPTGDEIRDGTVLDLDSVELMRQLLEFDPPLEVTRVCPVADRQADILQKIGSLVELEPALIVLIGGSGGGHRYSETLGKDYTHSALEDFLSECAKHEIYGKNGHLWTKLLCGKKGDTVILNVPGPFVEAQAAFAAYLEAARQGAGLDAAAYAMAQAVFAQYPAGAALPIGEPGA